jgi:CheY-like chemotaxis protein
MIAEMYRDRDWESDNAPDLKMFVEGVTERPPWSTAAAPREAIQPLQLAKHWGKSISVEPRLLADAEMLGWRHQGISLPTGQAKILILTHDHALALMYRVNLESHGLAVFEAEDGLIGLEFAKRERPDLILLDWMMRSGLDGAQVAEELRKDDIPFIFVTARREFRDQWRGLELGAVDYITVPCDPAGLGDHIRELVEQTPELQARRRARIARLEAESGG